jgi:hypothetical protein
MTFNSDLGHFTVDVSRSHKIRHTQTYTDTDTHWRTHRHKYTHIHRYTKTHRHTNTQTHIYTDTHRHTQTHTDTHRHTQTHRHTPGGNPLNLWSARRRCRYLHNTQQIQKWKWTNKFAIPAFERPQTYDRAAQSLESAQKLITNCNLEMFW